MNNNLDPKQLRERAYTTGESSILWKDRVMTIDEANTRFIQYFAENNAVDSEALQELIKIEKERIRIKYPDIIVEGDLPEPSTPVRFENGVFI